jgi:hypothetical protein
MRQRNNIKINIWSAYQMLIEMVHETEFKMITSELDKEAVKQNEILKSTYVDHK